MEVLKVSSKSNPNSVAGAIAGLVKESNKAEMQAIGAGALNQAIKAVAIARGFVAPAGVDLVCVPAFAEVEVEGEDRTGIKVRIADDPKSCVAIGTGTALDSLPALEGNSLNRRAPYL